MTTPASRPQSSNVDPSAPEEPEEIDFRKLFEENFDYVWRTLLRLGVRQDDGEDLAHEVFLRVHSHLASYDSTRPMRPWLFGFVYRVAAGYRRLARHRIERLDESPDAADPKTPADQHLVDRERRALVAQALDSIDFDRRAVFVLHEIDGVAAPEIADALSIPVNTVYSRLRVAREEFVSAVKRLQAARGER
jgi:RNA polymerase sigma-70 factor (ECF subfamily)